MDVFLKINFQTFSESSDNDVGAYALLNRDISIGVFQVLVCRIVGSCFSYLPPCGIDDFSLIAREALRVYRATNQAKSGDDHRAVNEGFHRIRRQTRQKLISLPSVALLMLLLGCCIFRLMKRG